jgi:hypothetical protein
MNDIVNQQERNFERHHITAAIEVYDVSSGTLLGSLVNIHEGGLLIVGGFSVQPDHVYQLQLLLPDVIEGSDNLRLGVDTLWVKKDDGAEVQWSGCQIIDLSDLAKKQITSLVELYTS